MYARKGRTMPVGKLEICDDQEKIARVEIHRALCGQQGQDPPRHAGPLETPAAVGWASYHRVGRRRRRHEGDHGAGLVPGSWGAIPATSRRSGRIPRDDLLTGVAGS
jgi:hypothetical protein